MSNKLKKYRFAGVAVVVAVILAFAGEGGEDKNSEETTVTMTEAYTVNQNQGLSEVEKTTTKKADKKKKSETGDLSKTENDKLKLYVDPDSGYVDGFYCENFIPPSCISVVGKVSEFLMKIRLSLLHFHFL